jgi:hypothetical protein
MAKKKQFAGKKTKLAKLPLTQALANQAEDMGQASSSRPPSLLGFDRVSPTWDEVSADGGDSLAAAFIYLVRELADLKFRLQSTPDLPLDNPRTFLPPRVPHPLKLAHDLNQARQSLLDLQGLLSQLR